MATNNGKRMVKEDLLNYLEAVQTNYPDPSDIGGGSSYTAGTGIKITDNTISIDSTVVALKSDLTKYVTTSTSQNINGTKRFYAWQEFNSNVYLRADSIFNGEIQMYAGIGANDNIKLFDNSKVNKGYLQYNSSQDSIYLGRSSSVIPSPTYAQNIGFLSENNYGGYRVLMPNKTGVIGSATTTANTYYIPTDFTDGTNTVRSDATGVVDLSSLNLGGSSYTAGTGIDITNDVISVDEDVAMKTDLSDYAKLNDDTQNITANSITVTPGGGYIRTTYGPNTIGISIPRTPGYTINIPQKDGTMALTSDIPSLTGYATESWVTNQGYSTFSGDYNDLSNKPTIPDAVSGTNDGANWTSLTIGSDTYGIPSGGSGSGPTFTRYTGYASHPITYNVSSSASTQHYAFINIFSSELSGFLNYDNVNPGDILYVNITVDYTASNVYYGDSKVFTVCVPPKPNSSTGNSTSETHDVVTNGTNVTYSWSCITRNHMTNQQETTESNIVKKASSPTSNTIVNLGIPEYPYAGYRITITINSITHIAF